MSNTLNSQKPAVKAPQADFRICSIPSMTGKTFDEYKTIGLEFSRSVTDGALSPDAFNAAMSLMRFELDGARPSAWAAGYIGLQLLLDPDAEPADAERVTALLAAVYAA